MTLKQYLIFMTSATAVAWGAVMVIFKSVDPERATAPVFIVLFAALLLASTGTFAIIGFVIRSKVSGGGILISRQVVAAFRQALLLSVLFVSALFLQGANVLTWWNAALLVAATTAAELFFASAKGK